MEAIRNLKYKKFIQHLISLGGDVYVVGGAVRDQLLGKQNKDIDLVVRELPLEKLVSELKQFGKVDVVGESFGVIKLQAHEDNDEYDIALPRTEEKIGNGHKGFDVQSDKDLPIETDLTRRDSTINSVAFSLNRGKLVDPLGGLEDMKKKQMRMTNPQSFSDDPLRMLRTVGFASRFGFDIEEETMRVIRSNASSISEISPERILIEFDKIVKKGNKQEAAILLKSTGLMSHIFGKDSGVLISPEWEKIGTMGEFIFLLSNNLVEKPSEFFKTHLKGDLENMKLIEALEIFDSNDVKNINEARVLVQMMLGKSKSSLSSQLLQRDTLISQAIEEFRNQKMPKGMGDLDINGNDLMSLGLKGKEVGDMLKSLLIRIYFDKIENRKEELLNFVKNGR